MTVSKIYKICTAAEWADAEKAGQFTGSPVDVADGFIHFSTAAQAEETAHRHFAGQTGLVLVSIDAKALADKLTWEPSRGGDLFPHLYMPLELDAVVAVHPLPQEDDWGQVFPELE